MGAAISTCAFLLLAYEWNSKFLVALAFISEDYKKEKSK